MAYDPFATEGYDEEDHRNAETAEAVDAAGTEDGSFDPFAREDQAALQETGPRKSRVPNDPYRKTGDFFQERDPLRPGKVSPEFAKGRALKQMEGASFGLAPHAYAGVQKLKGLFKEGEGKDYGALVEDWRRASDLFTAEHPGSAIGNEMLGASIPALATFGATAPISAGRGAWPLIKHGAKSGAAEGALQGAGHTRELENLHLNTLAGGALGALAGGAVGPAISRGVPALGKFVIPGLDRMKGKVGQEVEKMMQYSRGGRPQTIEQIEEGLKKGRDRGAPSTITADVMGKTGRGELGADIKTDREVSALAETGLQTRKNAQVKRVRRVFQNTFGKKTLYNSMEDLKTARQKIGEEGYDKILAEKPGKAGYIMDKELTDHYRKIVDTLGDEALDELKILMKAKGIDWQPPPLATDKGVPYSKVALTPRTLHELKIALGTAVNKRFRAEGGGGVASTLNDELKRPLEKLLDKHIPGYADARSAWAGTHEMERAYEQGRKSFDKGEWQSEVAWMDNATDSEMDAYLTGLQSQVNVRYDFLRQGSQDATKMSVWQPEHHRRVLYNALLKKHKDPKKTAREYKKMMTHMRAEEEMAKTDAVRGGSVTSEVLDREEARKAKAGASILGMTYKWKAEHFDKVLRKKNNALGKAMLSGDTGKIRKALSELDTVRQNQRTIDAGIRQGVFQPVRSVAVAQQAKQASDKRKTEAAEKKEATRKRKKEARTLRLPTMPPLPPGADRPIVDRPNDPIDASKVKSLKDLIVGQTYKTHQGVVRYDGDGQFTPVD